MANDNLPTIAELEQVHAMNQHYFDVISGVDGSDYSLNPVSGVNQKTLPALFREIQDGSAFYNVGTFAAGYTLTHSRQTLTYNGHEYGWSGAFPKVVTAGSTPTPIAAGSWVDRTDLTLRSELSAYQSSLLPHLESVYLATELDTTGATNESASIAALLAKYDVVKLPKTGSGFIRADITVPTGKTLLGSGAPVFNTSTLVWASSGTLIKGTISATNSKYWCIGNLSVDAYDLGQNGLQGLSDSTEHGFVKNVNTRANNHGQLWEQNSSSNSGSGGGFITVEDCKHYQGPNGFVSKMNSVSFIRCKTYKVSVQSFVAVSDNINGQGIFSRALNTLFQDCEANGTNNISLHIYSRNYHDGIDTVYGTYLTRWIRGTFGSATARHVQVGDTSNPDNTPVLNDDVIIDNGIFLNSAYSSIVLAYANRFKLTGCPLFGNNGGANIEINSNVYEPDITPTISYANAPNSAGNDLKYKIINTNAASISLIARPEIVEFKNTSTTTVSSTTGLTSVFYARIIFKISDNNTTCTFTGVTHSGNGTTFAAYFNGTSWVDLGEVGTPPELALAGGSASIVLNMTNRNKGFLSAQNGVSVTSITMSNHTSVPAGEVIHFRIINSNAASITITGWASNFIFADGITAPTTLAAFKKMILKLYCIGGGNFVVTDYDLYT